MIRILQGDVRAMLKTLPDESVHCCITSPPYWGLRCYGVDGQLGLETTMAEHIDTMVDVFREVRRVLRKDGTVWCNYGDCYASAPSGHKTGDDGRIRPGIHDPNTTYDDRTFTNKPFSTVGGSLKPKDLCMIPNRLAIALQDAGWWVRSEIIWAKPNPMPESVTDRPATAHEKVWLLSKSARYFYDAEAVREDAKYGPSIPRDGIAPQDHKRTMNGTFRGGNRANDGDPSTGRNLRNVWTIPTKGYSEAHFATYPPALVETCIKAGTSEKGCCAECGAPWVRDTETDYVRHRKAINRTNPREGGRFIASKGENLNKVVSTLGWSPSCQCNAATVPCTVLDPFVGSGTTAMVADRLQRDCIGIDLNTEYVDLAVRRITDDAGMFAEIVT